MPETAVADAATAWRAAGVSVVPTRLDGSKAPMGTWKKYITDLPTEQDVAAWFGQGHPGLGLVCGQVSGGLEMLELEGRAVAGGQLDRLIEMVTAAGLDEVWTRLTRTGYVEWTPSGGMHLLYRLADAPVPGNQKLARRPAADDELTTDEQSVRADRPDVVFWRVLAETRGEGGYVVVAPSHGPVHPSGEAWTIVAGQPGTVPTISGDEREQLFRLVRLLDEHPTPPDPVAATVPGPFAAPARPTGPDGHLSPGDALEAVDWGDQLLLGGAGWHRVAGQPGSYSTWRRPGKNLGISATTGTDPARDRLYVFSSSTPFETETPYTKFGAYAQLHHDGDHKAAAQQLQRLGYGTPPAAAASTFATGPFAAPGALTPPPGLTTPTTADPATPTGFKTTLIRRSQLRHLPRVAPLIHSALSLRVSAVLVGATGLGKTFVALSWACSIATGTPWLGNPVEQLKTLYVVGEGASGLDARVTAWEENCGARVDDDDLVFSVKPDSLSNPHTWQDMREQALDLGCRFVILDTFSSLAPDADETKDAATITRRLSDLQAGIDGTALLIHHPGWGDSGRTRGGYQLEANVDEVIVLSGEKDSDLLEMTRKKVKEGAAGETQWLRRKEAFDSVIIEAANAKDADEPVSDRIYDLLQRTPNARFSVPQLVTELEIKHRSTALRAVEKLVAQGLATAQGSDGRKTYGLSQHARQAGPFTAPGGRK
ncbi:AAA family ATPase [Dactylosporangium sp. CA-152071]|uniref:AAA family ATPase n=1 Tax=Dactylosporangium sp. CA-152071 TaxID=3239933 RepID=UPI003D8BE835